MRNEKTGKTVAKQNLPSKVCVVCNRPFTWRKKWERVWDEVTTCSKSCNAKRRKEAQKNKRDQLLNAAEDNSSLDDCQNGMGDMTLAWNEKGSPDISPPDSPTTILDKKTLRKQHKEAVKLQKQMRRAKRMGLPEAEGVGRKPCDLCNTPVDMLIRCTIDESQQYKMVCGKCWPSVSGGVPDGTADHPHYNYGGLWKNRNANLKKKVGSGGGPVNMPPLESASD